MAEDERALLDPEMTEAEVEYIGLRAGYCVLCVGVLCLRHGELCPSPSGSPLLVMMLVL